MSKRIKESGSLASAIIAFLFMLTPESLFAKWKLLPNYCDEVNIIVNRCIMCILVFLAVLVVHSICVHRREKICIKGMGYTIQVEYGDILEQADCWRVIPFDECFTTEVGNDTPQIKPGSICGQYLTKYPIDDMQQLIDKAGIEAEVAGSRYKDKKRYQSGLLVSRGDKDLLMAFAMLDESGRGGFTSIEEYMECLSVLWNEIDKLYAQKDVCISILGAGLTRLPDASLTQQKLLDLIIASYRISTHKIKNPCKLRIICKKSEDFSLNKIECLC
ncbi:MAG: DUF6430 domain-containing protein [Clostridiales bacterium]|nr:DUF6430 domain-containing protein [Clostridiales bacterium]